MDYREIVQWWPFMEAAIQNNSGETLRRVTIHALFPLSIFTEPLHNSEDDNFKSILVPDGLLNYRGDQMVAAALAQGLVEMKLIEATKKL